jgi:hypothetical protein
MRILLLIALSVLIFSCKDELDGKCSTPFKLSVSKSIIENSKKVYTINIDNKDGWWLSAVAVNGQIVQLESDDIKIGNSFIIEKELFVFEKINNRQAKVSIRNLNQVENIDVTLQAANCFKNILLE